jgi:hypothetical protein
MLRCAKSARYNIVKIGKVEGWNNGLMRSKHNASIFQHSNTPFPSSAAKIFLSSLQTEFFSKLQSRSGGSIIPSGSALNHLRRASFTKGITLQGKEKRDNR